MCNIDQRKYYILGSYALREHRAISDLDINIDATEFMKLSTACDKNTGQIQIYNNQIRWFVDYTDTYNQLTGLNETDFSIEAFMKQPNEGFPNSTYSLNKLVRTNGLDIDNFGHQHFSLKTLLKWKKKMNRDKDKKDIIIIKTIISEL